VPAPDEVLGRLADTVRADHGVRRRELLEATEEILDGLPADWAAVLRLRAREEMSYAEIAQALEMPLGSVMSRLARARLRLARALRERFGPLEEIGRE
jgi:RNA polymerase sigma-70 factor (ECF subfamily)